MELRWNRKHGKQSIESMDNDLIIDKLVETINGCYYRTRPPNGISNSRGAKDDERREVHHVTDFCISPLGVLSDDKAQEIWAWVRKWPIHPGEFAWGVDWSQIKAERVECLTCKGKGTWKVMEDDHGPSHEHTEHCWYCGGRGYQNRARRGMKQWQ
jgi:hypothetical protein